MVGAATNASECVAKGESEAMIGENRQLVIDEPVESSRLQENYRPF